MISVHEGERKDSKERDPMPNPAVDALWYLAPIGNLRGILAYGILSHNRVASEHISHERIDWKSVQRQRDRIVECQGRTFDLHDMVPLFFATHTPMLYVQEDAEAIAHIEVVPFVLRLKGTFFADGNAAAQETNFYYDKNSLHKLDWQIIHERHGWDPEFKRKKSAEVLVPDRVGREYFKRIHVSSRAAWVRSKPLFKGYRTKLIVSRELYEW